MLQPAGESNLQPYHELLTAAAREKGPACKRGHGRTGVVIGTWLIHCGLSEPQGVVDCLRYLRRDIPDSRYPSPETDEQVGFVDNWHTVAASPGDSAN